MKNIILLLVIALIIASVGAKQDCNCFVRAVRRCGSDDSGIACRNDYVARCAERCKERCQNSVKSPNACNCFLRAVKKCGDQAENADCRTDFVSRCSRRCRESCQKRNFSGRISVVNSPKKCNCFRRAVNRCGYGRDGNAVQCRTNFVSRCSSRCRESCRTTGRNSFRGCNCTYTATKKCSMFSPESKPDCFNFNLQKCRERCARVRSSISSCECFIRSVRSCGTAGDADSRSCRNEYVRKCSARCAKSKFFSDCNQPDVPSRDFPEPPTDRLPPLEDKLRIRTRRPTTTFRQLENITFVERDREFDGRRRRHHRRIFDHKDINITEEFKKNRKICISESGCNCKTISHRKCLLAENQATCVETEVTKCQERCTRTRRCYPISCENAGQARCTEVVAQSCATWFPNDVEGQNACITRESQCCLRREKGICKKARLTFRFRVECDKEAGNVCGQFNGAAKCQCASNYRRQCIADKFKSWRTAVRKFYDCESASAMLCQHKRCGSDYKLCVSREKSVCEPVCERESRISCNNQVNGPCYDEKKKTCTHKWRREYCEQRSIVTCDGNNECIRRETDQCETDLPQCFKTISMCNDNNACTEDFCDPKLGCVNRLIDCNDNNPCTEDRCDANLGCINTPRVCNDNKICTRDTCDRTTGECKFEFDRTLDKRCWPSVVCEDVTNCHEWGRLIELSSRCQEPICDQELGVCKAVPSTKECPEKCRLNCFPYHQCDQAQCEKNAAGEYVCTHKTRDCNDNNECTRDTCDNTVGCKHEMICPNTTVCKIDDDCVAFGQSRQVSERCQEAFCNTATRVCDTRPSDKACPTTVCAKNCFTNNLCQSARCVGVDEATSYCAVTPIVCDDKKTCTQDSCDPTFGCKFQFIKSEICSVICTSNNECAQWGIDQKLNDKCQAPVCNFNTGSCEAVTVRNNCTTQCPDCTSVDLCEEAVCVNDPEAGFVCQRKQKNCDDGKECTRDFCEAGVCRHEQIESEKCKNVCVKKDDCAKMYFEQQLFKTCQDVVCDETLGACKVVDREKPCTTKEVCLQTCTSTNPCLTPSCEKGLTGDFECKFEQKTCNDQKSCTMDFCDVKTGGCTFPFRKNVKENCFEYCEEDKQCEGFAKKFNLHAECKIARCNQTSGSCQAYPGDESTCKSRKQCEESCKRRDACDVATCVKNEASGAFECKHEPQVCNDNKKCTEDTCDAVRGCQFTYKVSRECPENKGCKIQSDCDAISASLKSKCKRAVCNEEFGRCDEVALPESCIPEEECKKECPHRDPCEFVSCAREKGTNKIVCLREQNKCNDNKECTLDTCDKVTGKCTHTLIENDKCKKSKICEKNPDCTEWAKETKMDTCYEPSCDEKLGICVAKPNGQPCRDCTKYCAKRSECESTLCFIDVNEKPVCEYAPRKCNDNNKCTVDSCDPVKGCVYTPDDSKQECRTPDCKDTVDCVAWGKEQKLDKCEEAYCDSRTRKCVKRLINTRDCNKVDDCFTICKANNKCETAECVINPVSKIYDCNRQPIKCDDKNECTEDTCDLIKGCKFTYKKDEKKGCVHECKDTLDCAKWGVDNKLSLDCKVPACNEKTTSCYALPDPNKECKEITTVCNLMCKPRNACEKADCIRKPAPNQNQFECIYTPIKCDDNKECTKDSCHPVRGCEFQFVKSDKCIPCEKTTDCDGWAVQEKLADVCQIAVCDTKQGTCIRAPGKQTEKCTQCKENKDCVPSKHGSLCCEENGQRKCATHQCTVDSDCVPTKKGEWGYCKQTTCANKCEFRPICTDNAECDDNNPCTKDVCVKRYGVCRWMPRCVDGSECTQDLCIPSSDNKSYQCRNPAKSCTDIPELLNKNLNELSNADKDKWLGKCSHLEGCIKCVTSAQCDDNNGCTADSCEQQFCLHRPIHNEWCDPKLSGQPITYQSIPSLRDPAAWFGKR